MVRTALAMPVPASTKSRATSATRVHGSELGVLPIAVLDLADDSLGIVNEGQALVAPLSGKSAMTPVSLMSPTTLLPP